MCSWTRNWSSATAPHRPHIDRPPPSARSPHVAAPPSRRPSVGAPHRYEAAAVSRGRGARPWRAAVARGRGARPCRAAVSRGLTVSTSPYPERLRFASLAPHATSTPSAPLFRVPALDPQARSMIVVFFGRMCLKPTVIMEPPHFRAERADRCRLVPRIPPDRRAGSGRASASRPRRMSGPAPL